MFKIEDKNIYCNRGDAISIIVANNSDYFKAGDYLKFYICANGDYTNVLFSKRIDIEENAVEVVINLDSEDTKIGPELKKESNIYWYEIELNGNTTLVGFDKNGPKLFTLWPEAIEGGI